MTQKNLATFSNQPDSLDAEQDSHKEVALQGRKHR